MENFVTYKEYCVDYIINRIDEYKDQGCDNAYDIAYFITEYDNTNGSITYSHYHAKEYIKEWFNNVGDFLEEYEFEFGVKLNVNPFTDCEKFHTVMVIIGVEKIINNLTCIPYDAFILTEELIKSIKKELSELNVNE
jgi:hypothetical protein